MAIKITDFGGTDWSDGEVLYAQDLIDTINYANQNVYNIAYGITPTLTGDAWTVDPTNLTNITDDDPSTYSTQGTITASANCNIHVDLGENKVHSTVMARYDVSATASAQFRLQVSEDNSTWTDLPSFGVNWGGGGSISFSSTELLDYTTFKFRYLRFRAVVGSGTATMQVYKLTVF